MTRETKVGLVVGTGIILLIGIVVSDHLASQQRGQQQTVAPTGYPDMASGNSTRTIDPRGQARALVDQGSNSRDNAATPLPPVGGQPRGDIQGNGNRTTPIGLVDVHRTPTGDGVVDRNLLLPPGNNTTGLPGNPDPRLVDRNLPPVTNDLPPGLGEALRNNNLLPEDNTPRLTNNGGFPDTHGNTGISHSTNTNTARATEPLIHHVQSGESLWSIAEKFYGVGNGRYYAEIARANADKLLPDGGVREGVRLVIPNKAIVTPGSSTQPAPSNATDIQPLIPPRDVTPRIPGAPTNPNNVPAVLVKTIKVEPGDALSTIASRELGSIRHMQLIIDANREQIQNADDIKAGMVLKIPALPAATSNLTSPRTTTATSPVLSATDPIREPSTRTTVPPVATSTAKVHKVQPRDTFTSIARARLGSERRWKELFEMNKDKVRSADALREGIVLVLPADAR